MKLYRAANDDNMNSDSTSFAADIDSARVYHECNGFGGERLFSIDIDPENVLDLFEDSDAIETMVDLLGVSHPGAIDACDWVPLVAYELRESGIQWVRVLETHPQETETWIFVGEDDLSVEWTEI